MARYIHCERQDTIFVEISRFKQLQAGTFEHAVDHLIDHRIDLSIFNKRYRNDHVGRHAWHPKILLKIILVGYSRGMISSREIASACEENVVFMALADQAKPDFTTIARFISSMTEEIRIIFSEVLLYCSEMNLIGGEMFAVDGHKISSNAAKEWSGKHQHLAEKAEKLQVIVADMLKKHRGADGTMIESENKRIKRMERGIEKIEKFLKEKKKRIGGSGKEIQSNITDNESAKMTSSRGVIQGYNGVAMVDAKNQIIVHAEAFGSGQEHDLLKTMIDGARNNLIAIGKTSDCMDGKKLAADSNYYTKDNCRISEEEKIDAYIPDQKFRQRDPRFVDAKKHKSVQKQEKHQRKYGEQNFRYEADSDRCICPAGRELCLEHRAKKTKWFVMREYSSKETDCADCSLRANCLQKPDGKRRFLCIATSASSKKEKEFIRRMRDKIDSPEGREIYSRRMGIVEPVFANIRASKKMNRLTLRGKVKVTIQWMLFSIVHNIEKISHVNYVQFEYG